MYEFQIRFFCCAANYFGIRDLERLISLIRAKYSDLTWHEFGRRDDARGSAIHYFRIIKLRCLY